MYQNLYKTNTSEEKQILCDAKLHNYIGLIRLKNTQKDLNITEQNNIVNAIQILETYCQYNTL